MTTFPEAIELKLNHLESTKSPEAIQHKLDNLQSNETLEAIQLKLDNLQSTKSLEALQLLPTCKMKTNPEPISLHVSSEFFIIAFFDNHDIDVSMMLKSHPP